MPSTAQSQLLKFALAVDPRMKTGVVFDETTIGTQDGDKHPKQRLLDMYNDARMLAASILSRVKTLREAQEACQNVVRKVDAAIAGGVMDKPAGYIFRKSLLSPAGLIINLLNVDQIPFSSRYEAANNPIMYEEAEKFRSEHGNTYIPDATNYIFRYVGVTPFTLADITGGTVKETFSDMYMTRLIQLAVAVEGMQGQKKPMAVAEELFGGE